MITDEVENDTISQVSTDLSGFISFLVVFVLIVYAYDRALVLHNRAEPRYTNFEIENLDSQKLHKLKDFKDSAHFILGFVDKTVDIFDNPYFDIAAYELDQDYVLREKESMKLRKCTKEDLVKFMPESITHYYPNSVCFANRDEVELMGNWFNAKFKQIHLAVIECRNTTSRPAKCKTRDEIK